MSEHDVEREQLGEHAASGNVVLDGDADRAAFVFVHGLGSSPADLYPLAHAFHQLGHSCELVHLSGHTGSTTDLRGAEYDDWVEQVRSAWSRYHQGGRQVFLVGFSIGATLALQLASEEPVDGVLGISTFLSPTHPVLVRLVAAVARRLPKHEIRRIPQTTVRLTRREIEIASHLPVEAMDMALAAGERVQDRVRGVTCPVLFLHSLDDQVAGYGAVARTTARLVSAESRLVTFRGLNHFLQFDVEPVAVRELVLHFFGVARMQTDACPQPALLPEVYQQCASEARHWARIVFEIIAGFFAVFGTFLYFSLEKVLTRQAQAPYYLIAYSVLASTYIILVSLYFFYLTRVEVYIRNHLEPQMGGLPWTTFRTLTPASGSLSRRMTRAVGIPIISLPLVISLAVLLYGLGAHSERFLVCDMDNILPQVLMCASLGLWLHGANCAFSLLRYANSELYRAARPASSNHDYELLLKRLYCAVFPGCVRQPRSSAAGRPRGAGSS